MNSVLLVLTLLQVLLLAAFCYFAFFNYLYAVASLFKPTLRRSSESSNEKIAVVVVCRNERHVIQATIAACDQLTYPNRCLIIADDSDDQQMITMLEDIAKKRGCRRVRDHGIKEVNTDSEGNTTEVPVEIWESDTFVYFHRPKNTGFKAGSLSRILTYLHQRGIELMYLLDADWQPQHDALERCLEVLDANPRAAFIQTRRMSMPQELNTFQRRIACIEEGCYHVDLRGRQVLNHPILFTGCCALLNLKAIRSVGGFTPGHLTEDIDLTNRLWTAGWKGIYLNEVVNFGELPFNYHDFRRQHERWITGTARALREHFISLVKTPHLSFIARLAAIRQNAYFTGGFLTACTILLSMITLILIVPNQGSFEAEQYLLLIEKHNFPITCLILYCLLSNFPQLLITTLLRKRSWRDLVNLPMTIWYSWSLLPTYITGNLRGILGIQMDWFKTPKYVRGSVDSLFKWRFEIRPLAFLLVILMSAFYYIEGMALGGMDFFAFLWIPALFLTLRS